MHNILIIDDDIGDQRALQRAVRKSDLGCGAETRSSVEEALSSLESHPYDCILMDYNIPGTNGLDGLKQIKKLAPFTPIIMVTGVGDELVAREALSQGASDYLPKRTITPEEVSHSVRNALKVAGMQKAMREQHESLLLFADVLAHDLKAPSRQLSLISELLVQAVEEQDVEKARMLQSMISTAASDMVQLIDTLHRYNSAASAKIILREQKLSEIIATVLDNLTTEIISSGAQIDWEDTDIIVFGDRSQLIQLFQNLVGNAIKFCREHTPHIHMTAAATETTTIITVCDNGIGIAEEDQEKIFQPFNRLSSSSEFEGSGLGLAICKKIIDRHYGSIVIKPSPNPGTCFEVTLPRTAVAG